MKGKSAVFQPFPTQNVRDLDPFLLLHHQKTIIEPGSHPRLEGEDPHPHRGFSVVNFVIKGQLYHQDSRGNKSVVGPLGMQWLDAAMGIIHSERPTKEFAYEGGNLELVQLWINLPERQKMSQPAYHECTADRAKKVKSNSGQSIAYLYTGRLNNQKAEVNPYYPVTSAVISLREEDTFELQIDDKSTSFLYIIDGRISVPGFGMIDSHNAVPFQGDGHTIVIKGLKKSKVLLMSGKSIEENYAVNGPFVMQNETKLLEAMRDYQMGKMGFLVEEF